VAQAAADALRLTISNPSNRRILRQTTVNVLWEHYCREELPLKEMSTQDAYSVYAKNWILPRWGNVLLEGIKTVEVERWLRAAEAADGTKAKLKCVMSALFSHAVRWEFCGHNPISSGIPVGSGGKRGPSTGVRVSAKRQEAPLFLSLEQVKLGLTKLEFRDQLLVFLDGALGTRRGELGALRWSDCNFDSMSFSVQHSYYWRRGGHLKATKTESSAKVLPMHLALKRCVAGMEVAERIQRTWGFRFPVSSPQREEAAGPCRHTEKEGPAGVCEGWHHRRGLAHFSAHGCGVNPSVETVWNWHTCSSMIFPSQTSSSPSG
jgi:integrase